VRFTAFSARATLRERQPTVRPRDVDGVRGRWALVAAGILVVTVLPLGPSASATPPKNKTEVHGYTCCTASLGTHPYLRGGLIEVDWIRHSIQANRNPAKIVTLLVSASGPLASAALKAAFDNAHPDYGPTNFAAAAIHVSDKMRASPVSILHVPAMAGAGPYELTITVEKGEELVGRRGDHQY